MHSRARLVGRIAVSFAAVAAITAGYTLLLHANPTTIALSYVVLILLIATGWGIAESMAASVSAGLCFNFFFLPPVGTFTIADPQNWVALVAFLATAIVASQLSGRARQRHIEVLARQRDLERLYALSRALLLSEGGASLPGAIARHIADIFEFGAVGLYDQRRDAVSWAGTLDPPISDSTLRDAVRRAAVVHDPNGSTVMPIQLGGVSIGSVAVNHGGLSDTVLHSIANLAAIGLERARAAETTARAEAARQSSELRATVMDALAHEFKTPLTTMKVATGDLLDRILHGSRDYELLEIVAEELDRLQGLVTDAVQMLRIDAGDFVVHRDRHRLADVVESALRALEPRLDGHAIVNHVPSELLVEADRSLLALAIRQLLDNAVRYSPPTSTVEIGASSTDAAGVAVSIRNSGSVVPEREQPRIFERFYRGSQARRMPGTGMGLAIVRQVAEAHGGTISVSSSPETGTEFTFSLPVGSTP